MNCMILDAKDVALVKDVSASLSRRASDAERVASALDTRGVATSLRHVTSPPSRKRILRTVGVALILTPDPVTTVVGAAMVGSSFLLRDDPANLESLSAAYSECMDDLSSLGTELALLSI